MMHLFGKRPEQKPDPFFVPKLTFSPAVSAHLKAVYGQAKAILEYGSGGSTALAAGLGIPTVSVESSAAWAANMQGYLDREHPDAPVRVVHADIGPTKKWGYPKGNRHIARFHNYPLSVWQGLSAQEEPDVILVDGRFRVACFLVSVMQARKPLHLLFDDYLNRPEYHVVERLVKPVATVENMAAFQIDPGMDLRPVLPLLGESLVSPR